MRSLGSYQGSERLIGSLACREVLTDLGPSFIKAGQVLASRPDIVREDYMNELCTLQDDVPSFSDELVRITSHDKDKLTRCAHTLQSLRLTAWSSRRFVLDSR